MSLRLQRTLVVLAGLLISGAMVLLGLWQMDVFRSQGRQTADDLARQPPVVLTSHLTGTDASSVFGRQVRVTGTFLPAEQFHAGSRYPLRVVTAFQIENGPVVPVVRGLRGRLAEAPAPPPGTVTVTGVILPSENEPDRSGTPAQDLPDDTIPKIRLPQVAQSWPSPLMNGYITLGEADAKVQGIEPAPVVLPEFEGRARNSGYALQWWVFAGGALVFSVVVARSLKEPSGPSGPAERPVVDPGATD